MLLLFLRLVHITAMATWIGGLSFVSGDLRRTLATQGADHALLRSRMTHATRMAAGSALVTVGTGLALIAVRGGFSAVSPAIHAGLVLGVALWFLGGFIGLSWRRIDGALAAGAEASSLQGDVRKLTIAVGVFHTGWLVVLVLMVFRYAL
jgi:hypothetical protein